MATVALTPSAVTAERRFYSGMALLILATVVVGFSRTFFLRPFFPDTPAPSEGIFLVHGLVATAWILLFVVQTQLVGFGRTALHRRLGVLGGVIAGAMLVLGVWGALVAARRATGFTGVPIPPLQFLAIPLFDVVFFASFVSLAIARRRDLQSHKRWMLLATITMVPAAVARMPGVISLGPVGFFGLADLFIVALAIWDLRSRGRLHPVTLWGGLLVIVSQPARLMLSGTDPWLAFARWATGVG